MTWFIIFYPKLGGHWGQRLAWGRWKHVECFRFNATLAVWEVYEFGAAGIEVMHLCGENVAHYVEVSQALGAEIVSIERGAAMWPTWNPVMSCVGMVKAFTRRGGRALRPGALYRILRREGAERAWEAAENESAEDPGTGPRTGCAAKAGRAALGGGPGCEFAESAARADDADAAPVRHVRDSGRRRPWLDRWRRVSAFGWRR